MNLKAVNNNLGKNKKIYVYFSPRGMYPRLLCSQLDLVEIWLSHPSIPGVILCFCTSLFAATAGRRLLFT